MIGATAVAFPLDHTSEWNTKFSKKKKRKHVCTDYSRNVDMTIYLGFEFGILV
jgi:hypothetical protein